MSNTSVSVTDLYTVKEAAEYLGVSPSRIRQMISAKQIEPAMKRGPAWFIDKAELDRVKALREKK